MHVELKFMDHLCDFSCWEGWSIVKHVVHALSWYTLALDDDLLFARGLWNWLPSNFEAHDLLSLWPFAVEEIIRYVHSTQLAYRFVPVVQWAPIFWFPVLPHHSVSVRIIRFSISISILISISISILISTQAMKAHVNILLDTHGSLQNEDLMSDLGLVAIDIAFMFLWEWASFSRVTYANRGIELTKTMFLQIETIDRS